MELLEAIGHPERQFASIHVGGTNGKGSTCAFLAAALRARGFRVGMYTSPHLVSVCERVLVDDEPISRDAFAEWTAVLEPHIERTEASFFEAMTAIAFADLASRNVDVSVIEVGLGGRLDSTNVITPLASVVTKIALEHADYLGDDLPAIAREKAGIAKPGVPFVTGEQDPVVRQVLVEEAQRLGAQPVVRVGLEQTPPDGLVLGLRGPHQWHNAWVALGALNAVRRPFGPVGPWLPASFATAHLPGRFDVRGRWIFDVAHNPDGMEVLVAALREFRPPRPLHALVGIRNDKDWPVMLATLRPVVDRLLLAVAPSVPGPQRWAEHDFAGGDQGDEPVRFEPDFDRALADIQHGAHTVLVTGSFHTVGDAMARLPGLAPLG
ncbi:MAG: bifunctional folylpolyglutamate synthase/dihydrofolate synthase [Gemmatimonadales bacterium]